MCILVVDPHMLFFMLLVWELPPMPIVAASMPSNAKPPLPKTPTAIAFVYPGPAYCWYARAAVVTWWKTVAQTAALAYGLIAELPALADDPLTGMAPPIIKESRARAIRPKASVRML